MASRKSNLGQVKSQEVPIGDKGGVSGVDTHLEKLGYENLVPVRGVVTKCENFVVDWELVRKLVGSGNTLKTVSALMGCTPEVLRKCVERDLGENWGDFFDRMNQIYVARVKALMFKRMQESDKLLLEAYNKIPKDMAGAGGKVANADAALEIMKKVYERRSTNRGINEKRIYNYGNKTMKEKLATREDYKATMRGDEELAESARR